MNFFFDVLETMCHENVSMNSSGEVTSISNYREVGANISRKYVVMI